jgi:hypothetical protein
MVLEEEEDNLEKVAVEILESEKEQIADFTLGKQRQERTDVKGFFLNEDEVFNWRTKKMRNWKKLGKQNYWKCSRKAKTLKMKH